MSALTRRAGTAALSVLLTGGVLAGCAAAQDEPETGVDTAAFGQAGPVELVVDTDLAADDLAALAWLLSQDEVTVHAVTVPTSGEVGCAEAPAVLGGLVATLDVAAPVLACGRTPRGDGGRSFPEAWSRAASVPLTAAAPVQPVDASPADVVADLAADHPDLALLALGPLTEVAHLLAAQPVEEPWVDRVIALGGRRDDGRLDGVAEWNAAADPGALDAVLAADVELTVVPVDAVTPGVPPWLDCLPAVRERLARAQLPAVWDLAAAGVAVAGVAAVGARSETGSWALAREDAGPTGRLHRTGEGPVRVVTGATLPPAGGACG